LFFQRILVSPSSARMDSEETAPLLGSPKGGPAAARTLPWSRQPSQGGWNIAIYIVLTLFIDAHKNILAPNLTAIADEFGMDDKERDVMIGGAMSVTFVLVGDVVALFFGYVSGTMSRVTLFCAIQLVAQLAGLAVVWTTDYWSLFWLRTITGVMVACTGVVNMSIIGDLFGTDARFQAMGIQQLVVALGQGLGQILAGFVGPVAFFTLSEPERAGQEKAMREKIEKATSDGGQKPTYEGSMTPAKMLGVFKVPTNTLIIIGVGVFGSFSFGGFAFTFLHDYLAQDKGMSVHESTLVLTALHTGICVSVVASGFGAQELYNRWRPSVALLMGGATILALVPLMYLIYLPLPAPALAAISAAALLAGLLHCIERPIIRAVLINVNFPETRGTALAYLKFGRSLGPGIIALLIHSGWTRVDSFTLVCSVGSVGTGCLLGAVFFTLEADEDKLQNALKEGRTAPEHFE